MIESGFKQKINRGVRALGTYVWSISDRLTAGIPDVWYCGHLGSLFIEYKFTQGGSLRPKLTDLQHRWLLDRQADGLHVLVVVGTAGAATTAV